MRVVLKNGELLTFPYLCCAASTRSRKTASEASENELAERFPQVRS